MTCCIVKVGMLHFKMYQSAVSVGNCLLRQNDNGVLDQSVWATTCPGRTRVCGSILGWRVCVNRLSIKAAARFLFLLKYTVLCFWVELLAAFPSCTDVSYCVLNGTWYIRFQAPSKGWRTFDASYRVLQGFKLRGLGRYDCVRLLVG